MAECEKCGKQTMSFTCRYCGKKYCSEHRLPENHECKKLEEGLEEEKQNKDKWFQEREVKHPETSVKPKKPSLFRDILKTFTGSVTLSIIIFTSFIFLLQGTFPIVTELLLLDPEINALMERPWSLLTVMLVHGSLFHIFANMITFYFFGTPLERLIGSKDLLKFYIGSGLFASLAYIGFRNLLNLIYAGGLEMQILGPAVGASGAVVAVFAAVAMLYPNAEVLLYFFIPMKIKTALYAFGGFELFNLAAKSVGVVLPVVGNLASSAHLAGLIIGVWYGKKLRDKYQTKSGVIDLLGY